MNWTFVIIYCLQVFISLHFLFPIALYFKHLIGSRDLLLAKGHAEKDYAIIVTAYEQTSLINHVVQSLLQLEYSNYLIYVIADKCDISDLKFSDPRVFVYKPEQVLSSNIKSHFYAISKFKREHEILTIIDSDNLVHPEYLTELDRYFELGYSAVQGVRKAKNLNSQYACLDEAGDMFYRFVDRKLLFNAGSSASLAGSGMAFTVALYKECLENLKVEGAGFDKLLQFEIIKRKNRIAFAERAIVFDEKTAKADQLVKQRARWINSWFKFAKLGLKLGGMGVKELDINQILFSFMLIRPPLFILFIGFGMSTMFNLLYLQSLVIVWMTVFLSFLFVFRQALRYFDADPKIYASLRSYPKFFYYQILALMKAKKANQLSVATKHDQNSSIEEHS